MYPHSVQIFTIKSQKSVLFFSSLTENYNIWLHTFPITPSFFKLPPPPPPPPLSQTHPYLCDRLSKQATTAIGVLGYAQLGGTTRHGQFL